MLLEIKIKMEINQEEMEKLKYWQGRSNVGDDRPQKTTNVKLYAIGVHTNRVVAEIGPTRVVACIYPPPLFKIRPYPASKGGG